MLFVISIIVGILVSFLMTKYFITNTATGFLLDVPNERSLHEKPIPRSGGIAMLVSLAFTVAFLFIFVDLGAYSYIYFGALILAVISFYDDKNHIQAHYRFIAHAAIAFLLVLSGITLTTVELPGVMLEINSVFAGLACILSIVWLINLYNFMDGMDGFAGGMAVIGFSTFALLGFLGDQEAFFLANISIVAAVAGFLAFNFPPAKIFMGDSGSSVLGLFVAAFILWADIEEIFPAWIGVLVFSPFIVDATVTLIRRAFNMEKVWEAHKTHYYQRLVQNGWGHKKTVLAEYALMVCCAASAIIAVSSPVIIQWIVLLGWVVIYTSVILVLNKYLSKNSLIETSK